MSTEPNGETSGTAATTSHTSSTPPTANSAAGTSAAASAGAATAATSTTNATTSSSSMSASPPTADVTTGGPSSRGGQQRQHSSSSWMDFSLMASSKERGILCNDPTGLCLAQTGAFESTSATTTSPNSGVFTNLVRLAKELQPETQPLITVETDEHAFLIKDYNGHAVALKVPIQPAKPAMESQSMQDE